jgi:hypothetical protein
MARLGMSGPANQQDPQSEESLQPIRSQLVAIVLMVLLAAVTGCEDGAQGPKGPTGEVGKPRPITLLIAGSSADIDMLEMVYIAFRDGMFPLGSQVNYVNVRDSVPSLSTFLKYEVVLVWSIARFHDATLTGNRLADYVDRGGKLVLCQGVYSISSSNQWELKGRVMSPGYSPLLTDVTSVDDDNNQNKKIDVLSLGYPLHPVFNLEHDGMIDFFFQSQFSDPEVETGATLLAQDTKGDNIVAINAAGNIIGLDMYGGWDFQDNVLGEAPWPEADQLIANCVMWVAGAY